MVTICHNRRDKTPMTTKGGGNITGWWMCWMKWLGSIIIIAMKGDMHTNLVMTVTSGNRCLSI